MDQEPRRRPRRHRWSFRLGMLLVVAGIAVLGWVGWQLVGTNWVSERTHRQLVEEVTEGWRTGQDAVEADQGTVSALVRVPRFGDDWVVPLVEGVGDDALAAGIGWFPTSARPGAVGNFALAGHRVTHGEPLRAMPQLRPGDEVVVETRDRVFTYVLDTDGDDLVVPFTETWVLDEVPTNPRPGGVQPPRRDGARLLTLTTCAELFHTDDRLVAFGRLASTEPRG